MPISSLIIKTQKDKTSDVAKRLEFLKGTIVSEIHQENIILITETNKQGQDKVIWGEIEQIPGVLHCDLIYHNFEDGEG
jgi:nitrate reductase NapAB chaperone NapD